MRNWVRPASRTRRTFFALPRCVLLIGVVWRRLARELHVSFAAFDASVTSHLPQVTLERGVYVLQHTQDDQFGLLESETVSMAMGLLSAVMGGAAKVRD